MARALPRNYEGAVSVRPLFSYEPAPAPGPLHGLSWCPVRSCGVLCRRPLEDCLDHGVNSHRKAPLNALALRLLKSGGHPVHEPVEKMRT